MQRSPRVFKAIFQPFVPLASRGRWELAWTYPSGLARDEVRVEESRCGRTSQHYCSGVTVSGAQARHTGPYRCRYRHRTRKQTSVYVYVSGKALLPEGPRRTLFVWLRSSSPSRHTFAPPHADCLYLQVKQDVVGAKYRPIPESQLYPNTVCPNNTSF